MNSSASTSIKFDPRSENEKAGLLVFHNEQHFYFLCKSLEEDNPVIQLYQSDKVQMRLIASRIIPKEYREQALSFNIRSEGKDYSFHYSFGDDKWMMLGEKVDGTFLSAKVAGGFVGCMYALYASSMGNESENAASYDWFSYRGHDDIYK